MKMTKERKRKCKCTQPNNMYDKRGSKMMDETHVLEIK